ncbi:MAG: bacillithiol system redox-active protein YtxJ [Bacteroidota bacterium]
MNWLLLTTEKQLAEFHQCSFDSSNKGVLVFKHSTRCSLSDIALNRLERTWKLPSEELPVYFLDLIAYRALSNEIASRYAVIHESPQVLIIKNGKCIYTGSHSGISFDGIRRAIDN